MNVYAPCRLLTGLVPLSGIVILISLFWYVIATCSIVYDLAFNLLWLNRTHLTIFIFIILFHHHAIVSLYSLNYPFLLLYHVVSHVIINYHVVSHVFLSYTLSYSPPLLHTQTTYSSHLTHTWWNLTGYTIPPELPLYHPIYPFPLFKIQNGRALNQLSRRLRLHFLMHSSRRLDSTGYLHLDTQLSLQTRVSIYYFQNVPGLNCSYDWIQPAPKNSYSGTT